VMLVVLRSSTFSAQRPWQSRGNNCHDIVQIDSQRSLARSVEVSGLEPPTSTLRT